MNHKDLIRQTADKARVTEKQAEVHIKALFEGIRRSVNKYEPVKIQGVLDINIHKYIFKLKMHGKELPMPEGFDKVNTLKGFYNERRVVGSFVKYEKDGIFIGVVAAQIGENDLAVFPIIQITPYTIGKYKRLRHKEVKGVRTTITPEHYAQRTSVKAWLKQVIWKIDPVISVNSLIKICLRRKKEYGIV